MLYKEGDNMPDYKKLYFKMFNGITDIIEELKKLQQEAEEMYIESCESEEVKKSEHQRCPD